MAVDVRERETQSEFVWMIDLGISRQERGKEKKVREIKQRIEWKAHENESPQTATGS